MCLADAACNQPLRLDANSSSKQPVRCRMHMDVWPFQVYHGRVAHVNRQQLSLLLALHAHQVGLGFYRLSQAPPPYSSSSLRAQGSFLVLTIQVRCTMVLFYFP